MSRRNAFLIAVVLVLVPVQALAAPAVCLQDQFGNQHFIEVLSVSTFGFIAIVGQVNFSPSFPFNDVASCPSAPLSGTGNVSADQGTVRLGYGVYASTPGCFPLMVRATLTPSGLTGSLDVMNSGGFTDLTFSPGATCSTTP